MATNIKRKVRTLRSNGTMPEENDLEFLICGCCLLDGDEPSDTPANLWKRYGKTIMELQGRQCVEPLPFGLSRNKVYFGYFERPAIWWMVGPGAKEPRRLLSGDPAQIRADKGYSFGLPRWFKTIDHGCTFESERDYIIRRGLLTESEKRLIAEEKP